MSCNCKNIIEVFQGGDVPLPTTFYSSVTLTQLCHTVEGTKDLLKILSLGAHPSPLQIGDTYCIFENMQSFHADEYINEGGTLGIDGELVLYGTDFV